MPTIEPLQAVNAAGPWRHRDVAANGMRFHVVEAGEGPLVLLVHGFPMFWWTWRHLLTELAGAGYRAVAVDLRGYGGSDRPPRGYDPFTLSRDIASVIRSLGEPGAALIGHGTGGVLAWTTAAFHPSVVRRLVTVSAPHPVRLRHGLLRDRAQSAALSYVLGYQRPWIPERQLTANHAAEVEAFLRKWTGRPRWPDHDTADRYRAAFEIQHTAHCALEFDRWAVRSIPRPDGRRYVREATQARVTAPVLQLHGEFDRNILPRTALGSEAFVDAPYAWRYVFGTGHFPHEEDPVAFNNLVMNWLDSTPPWSDQVEASP